MKFADAMGASSLVQMRAMIGDQILKSETAFGAFSPFVDGYVLPQDVYTMFAEGKQHDVPVLVGSNSDEGSTLCGHATVLKSDAERVEFAQLYPPDKQEKVTSGTMLWAMHTWARLQTKTGTHKA